MNEIALKGIIKNIEFSHELRNTQYYKANLIVPDKKGNDNIIDVQFKKFINPSIENDLISLTGTIRSYSQKLSNGKNKVSIYVFTYFDLPEKDEDVINKIKLDGRVCKLDPLYTTVSGKQCVHAIIANNLIIPEQNIKINNYLPIVFWGQFAKDAQKLQINDKLELTGQLHSRTYTKKYPDGQVEIKTAHEVVVNNYEVVI